MGKLAMNVPPLKRKKFRPSALVLIANAEDFCDSREPPFRLGDIVTLNSGGPAMMVVDLGMLGYVTAAYRGGLCEITLPIACVHRIRDLV
jgi:hypothetical protein